MIKQQKRVLIQIVGDHELSFLDREMQSIRKFSGTDDFEWVTFKADDWNAELSPWEAPAVFGKDGFGGRGRETLAKLRQMIEKDILSGRDMADVKLCIGGYSLAGLFALWSAYETDLFDGVAAASPSVWFPGFEEYAKERTIQAETVYLSLGKKEDKVKNPVIARVSGVISGLHESISAEADSTLEWNEGNHFTEPEARTAKAFACILKKWE